MFAEVCPAHGRTVTPGLRALPFVLIATTGWTYVFGQPDYARPSGELRPGAIRPGAPLTCYRIRRGDTAARLAQRLTGNAHNRHQPWFQILDPANASFVSKSRYGVIHAGWDVCVASDRLRRGSESPAYYLASSPAVSRQTGAMPQQASALSVLWWAVSLFAAVAGLVLAWIVTRKYAGERRASLDVMRAFGDGFILEFKRPLFRRSAADPAVRSRLRFAPSRRRLEVLLAPADGRTYPNLVDHRKNVEYDVERVQRLLRDQPFVGSPPYVEGPWVVIPFRLETSKHQEGVP
jgi:hypothetical protein